jgi:DNA-binding beta-propeller fold protein YncE
MQGLLVAGVLASTTSRAVAAEEMITLSGQYGTVGYSGIVVRETTAEAYVFTVQELELKFLPEARTNRVETIVDPELCLVTTYLAPGESRATRTSRTCTGLQVTLDGQHPVAQLHRIQFKVDKAKVETSTNTILDLSDGRPLWPFASSLKP